MKIEMGVGWLADKDSMIRTATPAEYVARIAELEAAMRKVLRHAEMNGMRDWAVFVSVRKALDRKNL